MIYTQRNEQASILAACSDAPRRRFLDIGAFDPMALSNTRALFEAGWTGVLIEPSPKCVRELVKEYGNTPDMTVICGAVSSEPGLITLSITDDAVSTQQIAEQWREAGGYLGQMMIGALTIPQILNQFGAFDFVSIDTEGTSVNLLHDLLATEMMPRCICVEYDDRLAEAQMAAQLRGYKTLLVTTENLVLGR